MTEQSEISLELGNCNGNDPIKRHCSYEQNLVYKIFARHVLPDLAVDSYAQKNQELELLSKPLAQFTQYLKAVRYQFCNKLKVIAATF
jgi:hypothetical protein